MLPNKDGVFYLASPYSAETPFLQGVRYLKVLEYGAKMAQAGYHVIEPIASSHVTAREFGLPTGYEFWQERDERFISRCDGVFICNMDGWLESKGVTAERACAKALGLPIWLVTEDLEFRLLHDPAYEPPEPLAAIDK